MMNLMKFKDKAKYPNSYDGPQLSASAPGREAYIRYRDSFIERAAEMNIDISFIFLGKAHTQIVAGPQEGESWDVVLMIKYPSWTAFKAILEDENYKRDIQPHRIAALQEFRSFAVTAVARV